MDRYKASIESVDSALSRLNQTLASYRLLSSETAQKSSPSAPSDARGKESVQHVASRDAPKQQPQFPGRPHLPQKPVAQQTIAERLILGLRATDRLPEPEVPNEERVARIDEIYEYMVSGYHGDSYNLPMYLVLAMEFLGLGFPDVAAGAAYKALLLSDALGNEAEEYHDEASESLKVVIQQQPLEERIRIIRQAMDEELGRETYSELDPTLDVEITLWLHAHYRPIMYRLLISCLHLCGCLRSAWNFLRQAKDMYPNDADLHILQDGIVRSAKEQGLQIPKSMNAPPKNWPDSGFVRRESYEFNEFEPQRLREVNRLNSILKPMAPKLEVRAVDLPVLNAKDDAIITQLGLFAKEDIAPGEVILNETSLLTANNRLQDSLCDACSEELPDLSSAEASSVVSCPECEVVFCSQECFDAAQYFYHPALCGKDVEAIAKDVPPSEAADSLYSLLLLRVFALAEQQGVHPLDLNEVKYIWGDFTPNPGSLDTIITPENYHEMPRTLPFSFEHNIRLPFHMLEKMDIDIFNNPQWDVWVFNTIYAKLRGTASARLSGLGGRAMRGPEVSAVHPMWCLANHSCDPNVSWTWGGSIKFWARTEPSAWKVDQAKPKIAQKGIRKGEEVLNHYCDIALDVKQRREWLAGPLGGTCQCERCIWEAAQEEKSGKQEEKR